MPAKRKPILRSTGARNALVVRHMALVGFVLKRLYPWLKMRQRETLGALDADDLRQEGRLGLMRAAELYDDARGVRFSTYAVPWIYAGMRRAMAKSGLVCMPLQHGKLQPASVSVDDMSDEDLDDAIGVDDYLFSEWDGFGVGVVVSAWSRLSDRHQDVILMRHEGKTLQQIGEHYGISRERARQIEAKGVDTLKRLCRGGAPA